MRKIIFLVFVLTLFHLFTQNVMAACYPSFNPNFSSCADKGVICGTSTDTNPETQTSGFTICCESASQCPSDVIRTCEAAGEACCQNISSMEKEEYCKNSLVCLNGKCTKPVSSSSGPSDTSITCKNNPGAIDTAIGCIPIDNANSLIGFILKWAVGIAGGIAFLLILFAGFQIMTSRGDPNRLKAGQELLTSAIAGLILLIFSIFILKVIGVDILRIPQFGK